MIVTVTASIYHAALKFAATKGVRYYLNAVKVQPSPDGHGVILIATDGHILVVLHDDAGTFTNGDGDPAPVKLGDGVILPRLSIPANARKKGQQLTFDGKDCFTMAGRIAADYVDAKYPDWGQVMPAWTERKDGDSPMFADASQAIADVELLARFACLKEAYGNVVSASLCYNGPENAIRVTFMGADAIAVIMPMRGAFSFAEPAFLKAAKPHITAAQAAAALASA